MLNIIHITATTLPDAWFQTIYNCIDHGSIYTIDQGSYKGIKRLELDYLLIHIRKPDTFPLLPNIPTQYNIPDPATEEQLSQYISYIMSDDKSPNESYTYGNRICNTKLPIDYFEENFFFKKDIEKNLIKTKNKEKHEVIINQIDVIISYLKKGHGTNQAILQIAQPNDLLLKDPPCLRHIDLKVKDKTLHFFPYFRSWDLWAGMPLNLAGISMLQQYMAYKLKIKTGDIIVTTKGGHIYEYVFDYAKILRNPTKND